LSSIRLSYDWGNNYGLPYATVSGNYPTVRFAGGSYWGESDNVDYPIPIPALTQSGWTETVGGKPGPPINVLPNDGADHHLLIVDVDNQYLYEIYQPFYNAGTTNVTWPGNGATVRPGQYYCASAAFWDMKTNRTRPEGWTSSDAAGLQVLPGLAQYDEVMGTVPLTHAHRVTLNFAHTGAGVGCYVWPATHGAGCYTDSHPPLGARFRLKASVDISRFGPHAQRLLQALKTYGLIFADNGTNGQITGTNDPRWGNYDSAIRTEISSALGSISFSDFEMVQIGWQ
jgi:hypothetical protein